jgi:hypothetical protein
MYLHIFRQQLILLMRCRIRTLFAVQPTACAEVPPHHAPVLRTRTTREMLGEGACFH